MNRSFTNFLELIQTYLVISLKLIQKSLKSSWNFRKKFSITFTLAFCNARATIKKDIRKKWQNANESLYTIHSSSEFWWTSHTIWKIHMTFRQKTTRSRDRWWSAKCKKTVLETRQIWRIMCYTLFVFHIFLCFCTFFL